MIITDKDTADDVKYHLMRENPPELQCIDGVEKLDGEQLSELFDAMENGKISLEIPVSVIIKITRAQDCHDFSLLADGSRLCKFNEGHLHCLCEDMVKYGECPKGCKE